MRTSGRYQNTKTIPRFLILARRLLRSRKDRNCEQATPSAYSSSPFTLESLALASMLSILQSSWHMPGLGLRGRETAAGQWTGPEQSRLSASGCCLAHQIEEILEQLNDAQGAVGNWQPRISTQYLRTYLNEDPQNGHKLRNP